MNREQLIHLAGSLPESPGVYKYFDTDENLIYIGKAKNLKRRVLSYFTKTHDRAKTAMMVSRIAAIQFTVVDTEIDALLLENILIKQYQPKYNVSLKDDKTYPYICIKNEQFPRVFSTRQYVNDGSDYYGPYASGLMKNAVLEVIRTLFPLRTCNLVLSNKNIRAKKFRVCLEYHIGNCKAPCVGIQDETDYAESLKQIKNILKGNIGSVVQQLKMLMTQASASLDFEKAALIKKKLELLENYQSKSTVVNSSIHNVDVFSILIDDKFGYVNFLKVANGMIIQTHSFELKKKLDETPEELLEYAIAEIREQYKSQSVEIVIPFPLTIEDENITFTIPKAGDKKKLLDLSLKNALYFKKEKIDRNEKLNPELKTERVLTQMMSDLRLTSLPHHIECFDNSNIQGQFAVSACVVFREGRPSKKEYRHFNVNTVIGPDDFATMREVVQRRYKRMLEEKETLPDLIVIDGGKGQLSAAIESMKELGIYGKVPVLGIAKRLEELYFPEDELPLYVDKKSETLKVIQQIRDEAHRFGITHHRNRRDKGTIKSDLDEINGIGEKTVELLLREFKSVKRIKDSGLEELETILGKSKAVVIYKHFHTGD